MLQIIAGIFKNRRLAVPKGTTTRPTSALVRAAVFNILQNHIEGTHVLDLCAGSGAMGFEALSRGAASVNFVEKDRGAALCIKENITLLKVENTAKVVQSNALSALSYYAKTQAKFDLIYIDPPYEHMALALNCIQLIDEFQLLSPQGWLIMESGQKQLPPPLIHLSLEDTRSYGKSYLLFLRPSKQL
ncbi:MAG: 16S rRNA (guanine(966)-N(2))-methyltransferase RsmD [Parachlamydiales bacterium]|jgi:16S rRNA (guanine(966)-N(2))-methyltransferase RsmD